MACYPPEQTRSESLLTSQHLWTEPAPGSRGTHGRSQAGERSTLLKDVPAPLKRNLAPQCEIRDERVPDINTRDQTT
ncbi:unnamed protein product [Arctogadus glacialis]